MYTCKLSNVQLLIHAHIALINMSQIDMNLISHSEGTFVTFNYNSL